MKIIILSFLILFNISNNAMSCPSSGDGDCLPSNKNYNKTSNKSLTEKTDTGSIPNYTNSSDDGDGYPEDFVIKKSSYLESINKKSKLNNEINKINFDLENIIYASSKQYSSDFNNKINNKLFVVNQLINQNKNVDKDIFSTLNQKIDKLLNTIIYSFNDNKTLTLLTYDKNKKNASDMLYKVKKYNEINDIIKTLEVMN